jgi:hypothetical protein
MTGPKLSPSLMHGPPLRVFVRVWPSSRFLKILSTFERSALQGEPCSG